MLGSVIPLPMKITEKNIEELLILPSLSNLIEKDSCVLEQNLKEESINHRFAFYLELALRCIGTRLRYHVDVEYDKTIDAKRP
jgi:hypothetical protein